MKKRIKRSWGLMRATFDAFTEDKVIKLSAALSYYTIFSLPPMLLVIIGVGGLFFGKEAIQGEIFGLIEAYVGADTAAQIQSVLSQTTRKNHNVIATIVGTATLLLGATGIFGEIQDSINSIWGLKTKPKKGLIKLFINRVMSFSMIIVLGFILMASLLLSTLLEVFLNRLKVYFADWMVNGFVYINYGLIFLTITTLFAFIFKVLPDARVKWRHVFKSALVTSLLFMIGKYFIGFYLQSSTTISAYGTAGSVILLLAWVYYSSIILYFGAEFTQVYAKYKGIRIEPNKYAVFIEQKIEEKNSNISTTTHPPEEPIK